MKYLLNTTVVCTSLLLPVTVYAGYDECKDAYIKKEYATVLTVCLPLAKQGDAKAQNLIGVMYDNGHGVTKDDKAAVKWYGLSADQGDANVQGNLGLMYANGQDVTDRKSVV